MTLKTLLVLCFVIVLGRSASIPDYIHVCKQNDPELGKCISNSIEALRPYLKVGIPELNVPAIEPLVFDPVQIDSSSGSTYVKVNVSNIKVTGASEFKILEMIPKLAKNHFRFKVTHPHIHLEVDYQTDSKILVLSLHGNGKFYTNLTDFSYEGSLRGDVINVGNEKHLKFKKMKLKIGFSKGTVLLTNLLNGDPLLGKATNDALNDNIDKLFDELKPIIEDGLSTRFTDVGNRITETFDYDDLFPKGS